jgi:hypothetical protein
MSAMDNSDLTVLGLLHAEVRLTGDDVRVLGSKVDAFQGEMRSTIATLIQAQNETNMQHASDIAGLKARDDNQQIQIDDLKAGNNQKTVNRLTVWAIVMGAIGAMGALIQSFVIYWHR